VPRLEKGEITADDLRKAEDMEIEKVVHRQASTGLKLATDANSAFLVAFRLPQPSHGLRTVPPRSGHPVRRRADRHDAIVSSASSTFPTTIRCWIISVPEKACR